MRTPELMDLAITHHLIEILLDQDRAAAASETRLPSKDGEAIKKSLESARMLMCVAYRLMIQPECLTPKESVERLQTSLEQIRMAARAAYQAGLLLTGRD